MHLKRIILTIFATISIGQIPTVSAEIDPVKTNEALNTLLSISNETIPDSSYCQSNYGQKEKVRDLLAIQLANLDKGNNIIQGKCVSNQCTISITHSAGEEDVSSAIIKFNRVHSKANVSTLECIITP